MIIFTNCLTDVVDEGTVKVANSLTKKIKSFSECTVVSYERESIFSDIHLKSNKLLFTLDIISFFKKNREEILYIPFPAKTLSTSVRILILSILSGRKIEVLLTQVTDINLFEKFLFWLSRAKYYVLSAETKEKFLKFISPDRVFRLKLGVDTEKFFPVSTQLSDEFKKKYGLQPDKKVVLHVGHLNSGRNISSLMNISSEYQVLLVTSTLTKNEQDEDLKNKLKSCGNIKIIDDYIPFIEEIYQLSDVYFFPVKKAGHCIDVPLSCLEAAACNKPIVTTDFGEMKEFKEKKDFYFIDSFDANSIDLLLESALSSKNIDTRLSVLEYEWKNSLKYFINR